MIKKNRNVAEMNVRPSLENNWGVERVISTTYLKISEGIFLLSSKLLNLKSHLENHPLTSNL